MGRVQPLRTLWIPVHVVTASRLSVAGGCGLMALSGIIEKPILSNFREGLTVLSTSSLRMVHVKDRLIPPSRQRILVT